MLRMEIAEAVIRTDRTCAQLGTDEAIALLADGRGHGQPQSGGRTSSRLLDFALDVGEPGPQMVELGV